MAKDKWPGLAVGIGGGWIPAALVTSYAYDWHASGDRGGRTFLFAWAVFAGWTVLVSRLREGDQKEKNDG